MATSTSPRDVTPGSVAQASTGVIAEEPGEESAEAEDDRIGRAANLVVTVVPIGLLAFAVWRDWGGALRWQDLVVMAEPSTARRARIGR